MYFQGQGGEKDYDMVKMEAKESTLKIQEFGELSAFSGYSKNEMSIMVNMRL